MPTVIRVENLSKKYIIGHEKKEQYTALRDVISNRVQSVFRKRTAGEATTEEFYALQDVSFDIEQGDRVGIIGRNGAGKSTLLKILSRITEPSGGRISIRGRVASLLEVGTGFHPELTGRENIYLNGAILGMSRAEIKQKFDEIVDFSEVERFLDTPVKRYSSGMYVRLAFAVAAHLEPEILIVDEVLAVGDAQFQEKCLGKMQRISEGQGRTILFVSHNIGAIKKLCNKGILLNKGCLLATEKTDAVISSYNNLYKKNNDTAHSLNYIVENEQISLKRLDALPNPAPVLNPVLIKATIASTVVNKTEFSIFVCIADSERNYHSTCFSKDDLKFYTFDQNNEINMECRFEHHTLLPGKYTIEIGMFNKNGNCEVWIDTGQELSVLEEMFYGGSFDKRGGYATVKGEWA